MGVAEDLATYLDSNSSSFTSGASLFVNGLPHSTGAALAIYESGGLDPQQHYGDGTLPAWENITVQLVARTSAPTGGATIPSPVNARTLMHKAWVLLNGIVNEELSGSTYLRVEPRQSPMRLPEPENDGRVLFSCNFDVMRVPSTSFA